MKKILTIAITMIMLVSAVFAGGCGGTQEKNVKPAENNGTARTVRIGMVPLPFYSHMWVAYKKGFLEEELNKVGYKLVWKPINLGPVVSEAFAAGEIDMGVMGDLPAFVGRSSGIKYTIVSASDMAKSQALLVNPKSGIQSVADLKGKKVATTKNTSGHELLVAFLEKEGMTLNDINFINMSAADLSQALIKGDIDAAVIWEPSVTRLEESGMKVIGDGDFCPNYNVFLTGDEFLQKNPAANAAVQKAFHRGNEYMKANMDECLKMLAAEFKIPEPQLQKMISKYQPVPIDEKVLTDLKGQEQFLSKNGITKTSVDVKTFVQKN